MTVDLTKLKAGDSVRILDSVLEVQEVGLPCIKFKGHEARISFHDNGKHRAFDEAHPFDILEIIPAPFDWEKVEQGDAFERLPSDVAGTIVHFIAEDFTDKRYVLAGEFEDGLMETAIFLSKDLLKPRPDIPNTKK